MAFPIDIKYIIEAEQELGVIFPDNFKSKMTRENGGDFTTKSDSWQLFPFFDKSNNKRISRTSNHIVLETRQARNWANFPTNGIAIASNGSGDYLLILPKAENNKEIDDDIFMWLHETGEVKKVANIESLPKSVNHPISKLTIKNNQNQKLNSLKTDFGFSLDKIPSPWILTETRSHKKTTYTFQIGKGVDCLVSLEASFPIQQLDNDKYWLDLWMTKTKLNYDLEHLIIDRVEIDDYSCIIVKSQNWIPVFYWIKSNFTDKWYLKMKTGLSRHKGDFKELTKLLNNIQFHTK